MDCSIPGFLVLHHPLEFAQTDVHWVSDAIQPSKHVVPFSSLQSLPASGLHIRWPEYWSFSFSISPSNEYSGLISFRIDWFDLLVVQGTLKSLLQHDNSEASVLWRSGFFMAQLSHPYIATGKTSISGFLITEPNRELALSSGCGIYERVFLYGKCLGCSAEWILSGVKKCQVIRMDFMGILPVCIWKHDCEAISKGNCHFNGFNRHAEKVTHERVQYFMKVCMWEVVERVSLLWPPTQPIGLVILPQPVTSSL